MAMQQILQQEEKAFLVIIEHQHKAGTKNLCLVFLKQEDTQQVRTFKSSLQRRIIFITELQFKTPVLGTI